MPARLRIPSGGGDTRTDCYIPTNRATIAELFDDFLGQNSSNPEPIPGWTDTPGGAGSVTIDNTLNTGGYGVMQVTGNGGITWASNAVQFLEVVQAGDFISVEARVMWNGVRPGGGAPIVAFQVFDTANEYASQVVRHKGVTII